MPNTQEEVPLQDVLTTPLEPKAKKNGFNAKLYLVAAIVNLLSFSTGITLSWVSPVIPKLVAADTSNNPLGRPITQWEVSWLASLLPLGGLFGPLAAGKVADKIGRKKMLLVLGVIEFLAFLIIAFAPTILFYFLSRTLSGVALGGVFNVLPMFLVEIAESHNRGTLGCSMNIFLTTGLNFSLIVGPYLPIRYFAMVCTLPLVLFLPLFFFLCPETPVYLASTNDRKTLEMVLRKLRKGQIEQEVTTMLTLCKPGANRRGVKDLFRKNLRKGLVVALGLITLQQCAGYGAIISYMQTIFASANNTLPPEVCVIIVGSFQVLGTSASTVVVDRVGRKILLLGSAIGSGSTLAALAFYFHNKTEGFSWLPILSLVVYVLSFSVGLGPVPWVVMAEIFPSDVRAMAAAITSFTCLMTSFMVTVTFPALSGAIGMAKCFLLFALCPLFGAVFICLVVPETKGKQLQDIQKMLK